jgi:hypothetical protein
MGKVFHGILARSGATKARDPDVPSNPPPPGIFQGVFLLGQYRDWRASGFARPWEGGDVYVNVMSLMSNRVRGLKDGMGKVVK